MSKNDKKFLSKLGMCASAVGCLAIIASLQLSITKGNSEVEIDPVKLSVNGNKMDEIKSSERIVDNKLVPGEPGPKTPDTVKVDGKVMVNVEKLLQFGNCATKSQFMELSNFDEIMLGDTFNSNGFMSEAEFWARGRISKITKIENGKAELTVDGKKIIVSSKVGTDRVCSIHLIGPYTNFNPEGKVEDLKEGMDVALNYENRENFKEFVGISMNVRLDRGYGKDLVAPNSKFKVLVRGKEEELQFKDGSSVENWGVIPEGPEESETIVSKARIVVMTYPETQKADLNGDGKDDVVLYVESYDKGLEDNMEDSDRPYQVIVGLGKEGGGYDFTAPLLANPKNKNRVMYDEKIEVENGIIKISYTMRKEAFPEYRVVTREQLNEEAKKAENEENKPIIETIKLKLSADKKKLELINS